MKNAIQPAAICLAILWCLASTCIPKTPHAGPTIPAIVDTKPTTRTPDEQDAVSTVAVPSSDPAAEPEPEGFAKHYFHVGVDDGRFCSICGASIYNTIHPWKNVSESELEEIPPPASPPTRAATATGRAYSQPVYQMPRRRLFGRFRR